MKWEHDSRADLRYPKMAAKDESGCQMHLDDAAKALK